MTAFIGSRNLGDEAIFRSIITGLRLDRSEVTALSVNEQKTREQFGVNTRFAKSVPQIVRAIRECDVMLVGGGGIIQDQSSILNFFLYAVQIALAKWFKKPLIFTFVGVGPLKFGVSKWLMARLMPSVHFAVVRDEKSAATLRRYMPKGGRIVTAHDPVLNFPFKPAELQDIYAEQTPYAVVSLRRWFFTNPLLPVFISRKINKLRIFRRRYDEYMNALCTDFDSYLDASPEMKLVLVSLYDSEDDIVNADVVARMRNRERVIVADNKLEEMRFLSIVKNAQFTIGMRLHSLILGANLGTPFVALRYSTKVDEFTDQMGLLDHSIHVERYDSEALQAALQHVEANREKIKGDITERVTAYRARNNEAFKLIRQEIERLRNKL